MRAGCSLRRRFAAAAVVGGLLVAQPGFQAVTPQDQAPSQFRFRTGVDLVNVAVTVTDSRGRFVPSLTHEDFVVYEDGRPQPLTHFANERVPVSLGLAVDTSGSMAGDKMASAREALRQFIEELLSPEDEVFLYRFSDRPDLVQDWTTDRRRLSESLRSLRPKGGTALYDTVAEAIPLSQSGQHRKKALVVISDGNDTSSSTTVEELRHQIRQTEVLVYAVGIDGARDSGWSWPGSTRPPVRLPFPFPTPGGGRRYPVPQSPPPTRGGSSDDAVNEQALREMTDDSGGRTEIIRRAYDLAPATASIANELSRQYFLGYNATAPKDGRWHTIRVEVRNASYHVRARRGYIAS